MTSRFKVVPLDDLTESLEDEEFSGLYEDHVFDDEEDDNMPREETVTVEHEGIEFTLSGEYFPYVPARRGDPIHDDFGDPPEGGFFEDYDILIGENSVYEMLTEETINKIHDAAVEQMEERN